MHFFYASNSTVVNFKYIREIKMKQNKLKYLGNDMHW